MSVLGLIYHSMTHVTLFVTHMWLLLECTGHMFFLTEVMLSKKSGRPVCVISLSSVHHFCVTHRIYKKCDNVWIVRLLELVPCA